MRERHGAWRSLALLAAWSGIAGGVLVANGCRTGRRRSGGARRGRGDVALSAGAAPVIPACTPGANSVAANGHEDDGCRGAGHPVAPSTASTCIRP